MRVSAAIVASALALTANAGDNYLGFNSGATLPDRSAKFKKDFEAEFKAAAGLEGAPGTFNAVRLYTNIQAYSQDDPIQAFEAAIDTKTHILLGAWASGTDNIDKEISALKKAVSQYGSKFTDLVIGISIGSEDLYRDSVTGIKNKGGVGNSPKAILGFIDDFKKAFKGTDLSKIPVGHVDTWDAWTNSTVKPVIDAVDFLGVDEYPFYESGKGNNIKNAGKLFDRAYEATIGAAGGKPVWVTETGWPVIGPSWDQAEASVQNAKYYWDEVGCRKLFNKTPTFWYNLRDSNPDNKVKFAVSKNLSTKPAFDLTCPKHFDTDDQPKTSSGSETKTKSSSGNQSTGTGMTQPTGTSGGSGGSGSRPGSGSGGEAGQTGTQTDSSSPAATSDKDNSASMKKTGASAFAAVALMAAFALL